MISRLFKLAGIVGGGILALGAGAVGTHLAYPTLEKNFFSKRIDEENKLKESLDDANEQVDRLAAELESQQEKDLTQKETITDLTKQTENLKNDLSTKDGELKKKEAEIESKQQQINAKEEENRQQQTTITGLKDSYSNVERQFNETKEQKEFFQKSLTTIETKLALNREDILQTSSPKLNPLKIETRKVESKGFSEGWPTFKADNKSETKEEFKIKKPDIFTNRPTKVKELQKKGITFKLDDSFKKWNKTVVINVHIADYFFVTTEESHRKSFAMADTIKTTTFKITDYFKESYAEDAFRVLMAIAYFEELPLCRDLSGSQEKKLEFCDNKDITFDFSASQSSFNLEQFSKTDTEGQKVPFWSHTFKTTDDFINYWVNQTIDLIKTGTIDLSALINPILLETNYQ